MTAVGEQGRKSMMPTGLINALDIQKLQNSFASVAKLFLFCADADGQRITEMSGPAGEVDRILKLLNEKHLTSVIGRVIGNSIEEQVVEDTEFSNIKIASMSVRVEGEPVISWFICAVFDDYGHTH